MFWSGAVQRWVLSQPDKAAIAAATEEMAGLTSEFRSHKETDQPRYVANQKTFFWALVCFYYLEAM